jgi:hypothetical protein
MGVYMRQSQIVRSSMVALVGSLKGSVHIKADEDSSVYHEIHDKERPIGRKAL